MTSFLGALIRRERLRQNCSQEGLCRGICAVSYLSKIEQGKAEAGEDILLPLLERLGVAYERDGAFLARAGETVESLYEGLMDGLDDTAPFQEKLAWLRDNRERCLASPYMLDALILTGCQIGQGETEELREAEEFVPWMTRRQYELYLAAQAAGGREEAGEELLRLNPCGYYTYFAGLLHYRAGRYMEAADHLTRSYDLAAQEGRVFLMLQAKVYLGNCFSFIRRPERMLEHYRVARRLAAALGDPGGYLPTIDYNVACTYLEQKRPEEALRLLRGIRRRDALFFHKLAIALEQLGQREEALAAVEEAMSLPADPFPPEAVRGMLEAVSYRLRHPDCLRDGIYPALMEDLFRLLRERSLSGFARFHLPYMLEALEAERRYKDAYRLSREFSIE